MPCRPKTTPQRRLDYADISGLVAIPDAIHLLRANLALDNTMGRNREHMADVSAAIRRMFCVCVSGDLLYVWLC